MNTNDPNDLSYFSKAKRSYKRAWLAVICVFLISQFSSPLGVVQAISGILMLAPSLIYLTSVALGIYYVIKSYITKEPYSKYRAFYLFGYIVFLLLILVFIIDIIRLMAASNGAQ